MFKYHAEEKRQEAMHVPFTANNSEDLEDLVHVHALRLIYLFKTF